jgi:hypothetical protein
MVYVYAKLDILWILLLKHVKLAANNANPAWTNLIFV